MLMVLLAGGGALATVLAAATPNMAMVSYKRTAGITRRLFPYKTVMKSWQLLPKADCVVCVP